MALCVDIFNLIVTLNGEQPCFDNNADVQHGGDVV